MSVRCLRGIVRHGGGLQAQGMGAFNPRAHACS